MLKLIVVACLAFERSSATPPGAARVWDNAIQCFEHVALTTFYYNCANEAFLNQQQTMGLWGCFRGIINRVAQIAGSCLIEYGAARDFFWDPCFRSLNVTFPSGVAHLQPEPRNESTTYVAPDRWQFSRLGRCIGGYFGRMLEGAKACEAHCKPPTAQQAYAVKACVHNHGEGGFFSKHPEVLTESYMCAANVVGIPTGPEASVMRQA